MDTTMTVRRQRRYRRASRATGRLELSLALIVPAALVATLAVVSLPAPASWLAVAVVAVVVGGLLVAGPPDRTGDRLARR
jgi:hypothetical protein